jgi:organic radical activating enzyme
MKHLRKFNENSNRPGLNTGSKSITISENEIDLFSTEPSLQKLIIDEKVAIIGNKVYYNDDEIKSILDEYLEVVGKVEESILSKNSDIYDLFGEFEKAKYKYSDEVQKIINKVASLEKTENNVRYLTELHKYYEVLHYVPANLMQNIELKK